MVDTIDDFLVVLNQMLSDLALPLIDRAFIVRTIGRGSEDLLRKTLMHVGADVQQCFKEAWARYIHHYVAINGQHATVFPGVIEALQSWQAQGLRLACVTNKPALFARPLLEAMALAPFFQHVFDGDAFERKKPDPLPLLKACEALGIPPAHTLMVGDSCNDALAARAAGCPVALVTYGYNHGESIHQVDADAWVDRMDRLPT